MADYYQKHLDGREGGWCIALTYMNGTGDNVVRCEVGKFKVCQHCDHANVKEGK